MNKKNMTILGILVVLAVLIGGMIYFFKPFSQKEPPEIRVTFQGKELYHAVEKIEWNGDKYGKSDVLMIIGGRSNGRIYVPEGGMLEIEFLGKTPKSYTLTQELYDDNQDEGIEIPIDFQNKKGTFVHSISGMKNTDDSGIFVGYRLTCQWGRNSCEYGFNLRSK